MSVLRSSRATPPARATWRNWEQQANVGTWSVRADVPPAAGYKPIFSYPVVNDYIGFLDNQAQIADVRKRFEAYTGPVVNTGGLR